MQFIQIGEAASVTVHDYIERMAAGQSTEIAQLKQAALEKQAARALRRASWRKRIASPRALRSA